VSGAVSGHRVRIAQEGWQQSEPARTVDEVQVGIGCWWVEIDGHRFDRVIAAQVCPADDEVTVPHMTLELLGSVEVVYVDRDGRPLPPKGPRWLWWWFRLLARPTWVRATPRLDYRAVMFREQPR